MKFIRDFYDEYVKDDLPYVVRVAILLTCLAVMVIFIISVET